MADLSLSNNDVIALAGDSLLFHAGWPNWGDLLTSYLVRMNPTLTLRVWQLGRSGMAIDGMLDSTSTSFQEYRKWVSPIVPKYVFSMFADNGGYVKSVFKGYQQSLVDDYTVAISGATAVMLGMIPQSTPDGYSKGSDYDDAIAEISAAASPTHWPYFQTWQALSPTFTSIGAKIFTADSGTNLFTSSSHGFANGTKVTVSLSGSPAGPTASPALVRTTYFYIISATTNTFQLSTTLGGSAITILTNGSGTNYISRFWPYYLDDLASGSYGVHPSNAATIVTAKKIIAGLGWTTAVSDATINGSARTLTSQNSCAVTGIQVNSYGGIDFTRLDARLPWAIDETWQGTGRTEAVAAYSDLAGWQSYMLTVTGLPSGTYDIYINGTNVASLTHTALAAGWNMADLTSGPVWTSGQATLTAIRNMQGMDPTTLLEVTSPARTGVNNYKLNVTVASYESGGNSGAAGATAHAAACASAISGINTLHSAIKTAAQPTSLSFSLRLQGYAPGGCYTKAGGKRSLIR